MDSTYAKCLASCAAVLSTKTILVHVLGVRSRVMGKAYPQPEDDANPLLPLLKVALVCYGNDFGGADFVQRCERIAKTLLKTNPSSS
mmetsp:Transcript_1244/g.2368  ORF Transcript_1244/g.2368 Transcript_1244/m.2368 type:complete len:87 (+) Transcript_1244:44-304(+)